MSVHQVQRYGHYKLNTACTFNSNQKEQTNKSVILYEWVDKIYTVDFIVHKLIDINLITEDTCATNTFNLKQRQTFVKWEKI